MVNSKVLILPGLGNSGDGHWQTLWQTQHGFARVEQENWDTPNRENWIDTVENHLNESTDNRNAIMVGHSLACATIVFWAQKYGRRIKGALLVAPSDTESPIYPAGTVGFSPMPLFRLPFPSITIASSDDPYVSKERAEVFSKAWGSRLIVIENAGHINVASGFGNWEQGLKYLRMLDD